MNRRLQRWARWVPSLLMGLILCCHGGARASSVTSALPPFFTPNVPFGVSLTATPDPTTTVYSVEEAPPAGWTVSAISHGGTYDGSFGAVKWGPFIDATPRVLSYQIVAPTGTVGIHGFAGKAVFDATELAVGGVRETVKFPGTLTRTLPTEYLPGVNVGVALAAVPAAGVVVWALEDQVPADWAVSAISHGGGFDPESNKVRWGPFLDATARTLTYTLTPPTDARTNVVLRADARFDEGSLGDEVILPIRPSVLGRGSPSTYSPGAAFLNTLTATPAPYVQTLVFEELLPLGWSPTDLSSGGVWDPVNRKIKWGPFIGAPLSARTFSYRLTPAAGASDPLPLAATAGFDDAEVVSAVTLTRFLENPESSVVRGLATEYRPGQALTVTNLATPIDTALVYAVEDQVPVGWGVSGISDGGVFDASNRRVKWGPYFDGTATVRRLTYQATPPADAFGLVTFAGSGRFDTTDVVTSGTSSLGHAPATVVRSLPAGYRPGVGLVVTLTATPVPGVTTYAVEEAVPAGWTVSGPSDGGAFDAVQQKVKWGPFLDGNLRPLTYTVTPPGNATGTNSFAGEGFFNGQPVVTGGTTHLAPTQPRIVGRRVFYNQSAWDGNTAGADTRDDLAIATDKTALLTGQKAGLANYTSFTRGINGILVDIEALPAGAGPTAADFAFKVGNNSAVGGWAAGPVPVAGTGVSVRRGAGTGGSDRVTLVWGSDAATKKWLQVRVKATAATGLAADDVFYFGNAIGEAGNQAGVNAIVNATDEILARNNPRSLFTPAPVTFLYDFNRDKQVNATDQIAARLNTTSAFTALQLITPAVTGAPALAGDPGAEIAGEPEEPDSPFGIVALADGRIVVHALRRAGPAPRLEMKPDQGAWVPAPYGIESFREDACFWLVGPPEPMGARSRFFRLRLSGP